MQKHTEKEGFPGDSDSKESACNVGSLDQEDPLEQKMATHSSILAWKIPWTEEVGGLQSLWWQRVGCNLVTEHALVHCCYNF